MSVQLASKPEFFIARDLAPGFLVEAGTLQVIEEIMETGTQEMHLPANTALGWFNLVPDGRAMTACVRAQSGRFFDRARWAGCLNTQTLQDAPNEEDIGIESALRTEDIEHACARMKGFEQYHADWDGEGALAPNRTGIESAIAFLNRLQPWHPRPIAGLDREGNPVIELHDDESGLFGKVRFTSPTIVEILAAPANAEPEFMEGTIDSDDVTKFFSDQFQITLRP